MRFLLKRVEWVRGELSVSEVKVVAVKKEFSVSEVKVVTVRREVRGECCGSKES